MFLQYSDSSGYQGIVQEVDFYVGSNNTTYPIAQKTRNANQRYREILSWIFEAYDGWQFNDANASDDVLYADINLVSGTSIYAIPATAIIITGADILLQGSSVYQKLIPFTQELAQERNATSEFLRQSGVPLTYQLIGDSIKILPPPNWTASASLRVYFWKDITSFTITDTNTVPGIPALFHRALSVGMALDYAIAKLPDKIAQLQSMWDGSNNSFKNKIQKFFSHRFHEFNPPRMNVTDAVQENM